MSSEDSIEDIISDDNEVIADESFDTLLKKDESHESEDSELGDFADDEPEFSFHDIRKISNHIAEIVIVKPENRLTSNVMSKFEMTDYVSIRTAQIADYNNCMVDISGLDNPVDMAKRELMKRKCPLMLRRYVGRRQSSRGEWVSYYEDWNPAEMTFAVHH